MKLNENNSRKFDRAVTALIFMGFLFIGACCLCSCEKPEDNLINQHYEKIEEQKTLETLMAQCITLYHAKYNASKSEDERKALTQDYNALRANPTIYLCRNFLRKWS